MERRKRTAASQEPGYYRKIVHSIGKPIYAVEVCGVRNTSRGQLFEVKWSRGKETTWELKSKIANKKLIEEYLLQLSPCCKKPKSSQSNKPTPSKTVNGVKAPAKRKLEELDSPEEDDITNGLETDEEDEEENDEPVFKKRKVSAYEQDDLWSEEKELQQKKREEEKAKRQIERKKLLLETRLKREKDKRMRQIGDKIRREAEKLQKKQQKEKDDETQLCTFYVSQKETKISKTCRSPSTSQSKRRPSMSSMSGDVRNLLGFDGGDRRPKELVRRVSCTSFVRMSNNSVMMLKDDDFERKYPSEYLELIKSPSRSGFSSAVSSPQHIQSPFSPHSQGDMSSMSYDPDSMCSPRSERRLSNDSLMSDDLSVDFTSAAESADEQSQADNL